MTRSAAGAISALRAQVAAPVPAEVEKAEKSLDAIADDCEERVSDDIEEKPDEDMRLTIIAHDLRYAAAIIRSLARDRDTVRAERDAAVRVLKRIANATKSDSDYYAQSWAEAALAAAQEGAQADQEGGR